MVAVRVSDDPCANMYTVLRAVQLCKSFVSVLKVGLVAAVNNDKGSVGKLYEILWIFGSNGKRSGCFVPGTVYQKRNL